MNDKEYYAKWYQANRERKLAAKKEYRQLHKEEGNKHNREWYARNKEKAKAKVNNWILKNRDKQRASSSKSHKNKVDVLKDDYIKKLLRQSGFTNETILEHPLLIESKRLIIKTQRLCK